MANADDRQRPAAGTDSDKDCLIAECLSLYRTLTKEQKEQVLDFCASLLNRTEAKATVAK